MQNLLQKLSRHLWLQGKLVSVKKYYVYYMGITFCLIFGLLLLHLPEKAPEAAKPKDRAGSRKAPGKVCFCSYVLFFLGKDELKERLAAYNLDASPDQSAGKCYIIIFH